MENDEKKLAEALTNSQQTWNKSTNTCDNKTFTIEIAQLLLKGESKKAHYKTARQIMTQHSFITNPNNDTIYAYQNGLYSPHGEPIIKMWTQHTLGSLRNRQFDAEVISHISNTTINLHSTTEPPADLLCVKNCILNTITMQTEQHTPQHIFYSQIPINYDTQTKCPKFEQFLSEIVNPPYQQTLQEIAGYCLIRTYPTAKGFMLYGEGNNGKSTFLKIIDKLLGEENVCHIPLHKLNKDRFSTAQLQHKHANTFSELSDAEIKDLSIFKAATGGDTLYGEHKFKNPFPFTNYAKQIFSTNKIPLIDSENDNLATWRRWLLIPFPNNFIGKENKHLTAELLEELPGILNWALQGLKRLRENDWVFTREETPQITRQQYLENSDSIGSFCCNELYVNPDGKIRKKQLYLEYANFCRLTKKPIETENKFYRRLPEFFQITEFQHKDEYNHRERYIGGIELTQTTRDTQLSTPTKRNIWKVNYKKVKSCVCSVSGDYEIDETLVFPDYSSFDKLNEPHGLIEGLPSACALCGLKRCYYIHKVTFKPYCPSCAESVEKGWEVAK